MSKITLGPDGIKYDEEKKMCLFLKGPLSQWYGEFRNQSSSRISFMGLEFNCAEQWMMWCKAVIFGDDETANAILETKHPRYQKALGRSVRN